LRHAAGVRQNLSAKDVAVLAECTFQSCERRVIPPKQLLAMLLERLSKASMLPKTFFGKSWLARK
jgi:hypothetical protein